jgi:hypothetical protein
MVCGPAGTLVLVGVLAAVIVGGAGIWKTLEKAGLSGSDSLVPILNTKVLIRMAGLEDWKIPCLALLLGPFLLCCIPFGIAQQFGKGRLFGLGLLLLPFVFFPILGFGKARYSGEGAKSERKVPPSRGV